MSLSLTLSQLSIIEKAYLFTEGFTIRAPQTRTEPFRTRTFMDLQRDLRQKGTKDEVVEVGGPMAVVHGAVPWSNKSCFFNFVM